MVDTAYIARIGSTTSPNLAVWQVYGALQAGDLLVYQFYDYSTPRSGGWVLDDPGTDSMWVNMSPAWPRISDDWVALTGTVGLRQVVWAKRWTRPGDESFTVTHSSSGPSGPFGFGHIIRPSRPYTDTPTTSKSSVSSLRSLPGIAVTRPSFGFCVVAGSPGFTATNGWTYYGDSLAGAVAYTNLAVGVATMPTVTNAGVECSFAVSLGARTRRGLGLVR
jgi:hypothetical protein